MVGQKVQQSALCAGCMAEILPQSTPQRLFLSTPARDVPLRLGRNQTRWAWPADLLLIHPPSQQLAKVSRNPAKMNMPIHFTTHGYE